MSIKTRQIAEEARLLASQASPPTTGSGKGAFFALDIGGGETEAAYVDEAGNVTQITDAGALNLAGLALVVKDEGSIKDSAVTEIDFVGTGVTATQTAPGVIQVSVSAGGSALTVKDEGVIKDSAVTEIDFLGAGVTAVQNGSGKIEVTIPGGSGFSPLWDEYKFDLSAGATIAARIATGLPGGWSAVDGTDVSVDAELSGSADDLVIVHGESKTAIELVVIKIDTTTPFGGSGRFVVDSSGAAGERIKTNTLQTQSRFKNFQLDVGAANAAIVYIKLL